MDKWHDGNEAQQQMHGSNVGRWKVDAMESVKVCLRSWMQTNAVSQFITFIRVAALQTCTIYDASKLNGSWECSWSWQWSYDIITQCASLISSRNRIPYHCFSFCNLAYGKARLGHVKATAMSHSDIYFCFLFIYTYIILTISEGVLRNAFHSMLCRWLAIWNSLGKNSSNNTNNRDKSGQIIQ